MAQMCRLSMHGNLCGEIKYSFACYAHGHVQICWSVHSSSTMPFFEHWILTTANSTAQHKLCNTASNEMWTSPFPAIRHFILESTACFWISNSNFEPVHSGQSHSHYHVSAAILDMLSCHTVSQHRERQGTSSQHEGSPCIKLQELTWFLQNVYGRWNRALDILWPLH